MKQVAPVGGSDQEVEYRNQVWQSHRLGRSLLTTFAIQGLGIMSGALAARLLGVENRGLLAAVMLWPSVIAYVGLIGGPTAYTYLAANRKAPIATLSGNAVLISVLQAALLAVVGIPIVVFALAKYPAIVGLAIVFLVAFIPLSLLTRYLNALNQGQGRFAQFNVIRLSVQVIYVLGIGILTLLHAYKLKWTLIVVLLSNAGAAAIALVIMLKGIRFRPRVELATITETFRYGVRAHLGNLAPIDAMQLDLVAVVLLLGPRDAGLYSIGLATALTVRAVGTTMGMVALPEIAAATPTRIGSTIGKLVRLAVIFNLLVAGTIFVLAGTLVPIIYGHQYAPAILLARILIVATVAASLKQVMGDCLRGAGRPLSGTIAEVVGWPVAAIGLAILVPRFGSIGAATAVLICYGSGVLASALLARPLGISFSDLFIPRRSDFDQAWRVVRVFLGIPATTIRPEVPRPV